MIDSKLGRRHKSDQRPKLKIVSFKADAEVLEALGQLEAAMIGSDVRGKTSVVLRKLILDAVGKL